MLKVSFQFVIHEQTDTETHSNRLTFIFNYEITTSDTTQHKIPGRRCVKQPSPAQKTAVRPRRVPFLIGLRCQLTMIQARTRVHAVRSRLKASSFIHARHAPVHAPIHRETVAPGCVGRRRGGEGATVAAAAAAGRGGGLALPHSANVTRTRAARVAEPRRVHAPRCTDDA